MTGCQLVRRFLVLLDSSNSCWSDEMHESDDANVDGSMDGDAALLRGEDSDNDLRYNPYVKYE